MKRFFFAGIGWWLCTALSAQEPTPIPAPPAALPPVVARYEQMLASSPAKGTAFDKVYQHFFEGEGLDALDARWRARAAAGGPGAPAFLLLEGLLAERRAHPADARTLYQQYTAAHPEDPRGWIALGELESSEGRFRPAADALAHALAPEAQPPVPASQRPTVYRALARAQTRDFLGAAALATWRKLAGEFPDDPTVLQEVGEAFQEGESYVEARETFEKLRELARKNGDAFGRVNATLRLGQIEEARGHAKEAVAVYEGVVADAKPGSWLEREARARIEQLYRGQEDLPGLAEYYKKWLADHPKDIEVATRRAAVLVELNRKTEAIDLLREAVAWAPDRQELQVELARRQGETNRPAEAIAVMEKLTAVAPEEKSYWQFLGDARWQALDIGPTATTMPPEEKARLRTAALDAWNHLSPADGRDAVATGQLADLFASHRLVDEALAQYTRAAALAPELPDTRERWAAYLAQINRRDEARRVLAGLVSADARNATAANYARLASGLDRLDDPDGALDATTKGLALDPKNFDLLALRWQLLSSAKKWDDALALYPTLLAAAPNAYFAEQVRTRHVSALQAAGKLADTRKALAARLGAAAPADGLDENELALLLRADFQSGEDANEPADEARRALVEGRTRFPQSVPLLRLEGEAAKRAHDPDAQVAALRRLLDLQPLQKTDVLQEITRVWRDAGRLDDALAAARELVAASPANAASYLLEADLLLQGDHPDEGLARLREAVRLSEKPNEVRLRLARTQSDLGRVAEARKTLDEAFEGAADARERLGMMKSLADAYQRENRLDELIARFQRLQQAEADGWRYALYLAEIYQQTLDFGGARRELAKALAARPRDGALLRQLVRLSNEEQNTAEAARYQALLTEAEPSDQNKLALVEALFDNNQPTEGFNALQANLSAILKIPGAWNQLLPALAHHDLTTKAGELLTRETGGPDADLKSRFTLALFQAIAGDMVQAKTAFWTVFASKSPRPPAPPAPTPPATSSSYAFSLYQGGGVAQRRYQEAMYTQNMAQNFLSNGGKNMGRSRNFYSVGNSPQPGGPGAADTARDAALLYLAAIAVKENDAVPFLAELGRRLDARDSSREDRLVAWALVDAVEPFLQETAAQIRTPDPEMDVFCLSHLMQLASMNDPSQRQYYQGRPVLTDAQATTMESLFETLVPRSTKNFPPGSSGMGTAMRYAFLKGLDRKDQAEALRHQALAELTGKTEPGSSESALQMLMEGPLPAPEQAQLKEVCRALAAAAAKPAAGTPASRNVGQSFYYYPLMPWQQNSAASKLPPAEMAQVEADLLSLWYPAAPPPPSGSALGNSNPYGYRYSNGSPRDEGYLPPTRYLDIQHVRVLQQLAQYAQNQSEWLTLLGAQLDRQATELPAPVQIYPRLMAAYLAAASGDKTRALTLAQALLAEQPDDNDLRLFTGLLLGRNDRPAEAVAVLNAITNARYGEAAVSVQQLLLLNAKAAKDTDNARRAALKLVSLRLIPEERAQLATDLRELGINDKADQVARAAVPTARSASSGRPASIFDYQTGNQLQTFVSSKNNDAALNLIRQVFAAMPPPANGNGEDYVVSQAVSTLNQLGKTDQFIADAEKQLAKAPDSLSLNYQLAVLSQRDDQSWTKEKRPPGKHAAPLWVRLTRGGDAVTGWYSTDGERWQEIDHAVVPLGAAPLAALAAATSQKGAKAAPNVVVDHVALTPTPAADATAGSALPAPWQETILPTDKEKENTVPPSLWQDGTFTLHAAGWDLWGRYDDTRMVHRPLDEATEFVARVVSVEGPDGETKAGVMWRADLTADSPYAAVIVLPGGGLTFQHRDRTNQSTEYWRKVVALQPKDPRYRRALARSLAGRGLRDEAVALFDALIAENPEEGLSHGDDLSTVYGTERMPELAERLLAWRPTNVNGMRSNPVYSYETVAEACATKHQFETVIALCRRGLELDAENGGYNSTDLYDRLINTFLEQKRPEQARDALLACYLPPKDGSVSSTASAPQLGFRNNVSSRAQNAANWMWSTSRSGSDLSLSNLATLEVGNKAGLLDSLQAALEARRSENATRFAADGFDWLLTLVQLDRRDPAVLEGLPALLTKTANANYRGNEDALVAVRLEVARRLRRWPGHEALSLEAYRSARGIAAASTRQRNSSYENLSVLIGLQQAATELVLEDPAAAAATLRAVAGDLSPGTNPARGMNKESTKTCLNMLLRAGPAADAAYVELYTRATATEQGKKDFYFSYALEKNQRLGDNQRFTAMAWLLDDGGGDGDDATLVYELRPQHPYDKGDRGRYPGSRGRSFPASEGGRTLTFSYGPDADHFAPVGRLETTATFGTWRGPVPRGSGVLKVTVDGPRSADIAGLAVEDARKAAGVVQATPTPTPPPTPSSSPGPAASPAPPPGDYWLPVVRSSNLMSNPSFEGLSNRDPAAKTFSLAGWADLPGCFWRQATFESPLPGRGYVWCELSRENDRTLIGERVPVEVGHAYFQSAWLRDAGDGASVHVGRRYLDANGKVLKTSECPDFSTLLWRWHSQRILSTGNEKDADTIPAGTVFIEPFIRGQGSVGWTGLFVGRVD